MPGPAARGVEHPWRVLDLLDAADAAIGMNHQVLRVEVPGRVPVDAPVGDVAVVLARDTVTVSGEVLAALSARGAALLVCDWRGVPVGGTWPWRGHSRIGARQRAQVTASPVAAKRVWAVLVRAKIGGQAHVLRAARGGDLWRSVVDVSGEVRSGDVTNREAVAAAIYWRALWPGFVRDRFGADERNRALNYGYTVLRGHAIRAVTAAGLCPTIGVFHRGAANMFALADDLIEPFRPCVDAAVLALESEGLLDMSLPQCRKRLVEAGYAPMHGRSGPSAIAETVASAQRLGEFFEATVHKFTVASWRGEPCG